MTSSCGWVCFLAGTSHLSQVDPTLLTPHVQEAVRLRGDRHRRLGSAEARYAWLSWVLFLYFSIPVCLHVLFWSGKDTIWEYILSF